MLKCHLYFHVKLLQAVNRLHITLHRPCQAYASFWIPRKQLVSIKTKNTKRNKKIEKKIKKKFMVENKRRLGAKNDGCWIHMGLVPSGRL